MGFFVFPNNLVLPKALVELLFINNYFHQLGINFLISEIWGMV
jgi:hypothetical protein